MGLIAESAKPLRPIERDFIIDSTGFATSRFFGWFYYKYGVVKKEYDWVKVSVCTGRTTNVITAVEIDVVAARCGLPGLRSAPQRHGRRWLQAS